MATAVKDLYQFIRFLAIRDNNKEVITEDDMDLAIRFTIRFDFPTGFVAQENGDAQLEITPDLNNTQEKLLVYKTAFSLLELEDAFSYKTAVLEKEIKGTPGLENVKKELGDEIRELELGEFGIALASENEFDKAVNLRQRQIDTINEAQATN